MSLGASEIILRRHPSPSGGGQPTQGLPDFYRVLSDAGRVNNLDRLEPVELARGTDGVGAHILPSEPVVNLEVGRELGDGGHAVDRVAGRAPDAAGFEDDSSNSLVLGRHDGRERSSVG